MINGGSTNQFFSKYSRPARDMSFTVKDHLLTVVGAELKVKCWFKFAVVETYLKCK